MPPNSYTPHEVHEEQPPVEDESKSYTPRAVPEKSGSRKLKADTSPNFLDEVTFENSKRNSTRWNSRAAELARIDRKRRT